MTPVNLPSTHWRTVATPSAPLRHDARNMHLLASPAGSPMSVTAVPSPPKFEDATPVGVPTTSWRRVICPNAPVRRETRLASASSTPCDYSPLNVSGPFPPTPANLWPSAFASDSPMNGSYASSPMSSGLMAPQPVRYIRALSLDSSPTSSLGGSPLNTAFIASSMSIDGWRSSTTSQGDASIEVSPFFVDATPIAKVNEAGPKMTFFPYNGKDQQKIAEDPRRPLGPSNTDWVRKLGA